MEGKRSGWLDALVARQSDFSSFDVDTPLLNWANALSITSTQHFLLRLVVVLPAFRQSVEDLAVLELTDNAGATALTAAATAIITASLLQLPYIQVVGVPEQPFVGEISRAFAVVQEAKSAQGHLSDVKDSLTYFFGQLLSVSAIHVWNASLDISGLADICHNLQSKGGCEDQSKLSLPNQCKRSSVIAEWIQPIRPRMGTP